MTQETARSGYTVPEPKKPLFDLRELVSMSNRLVGQAIGVNLEVQRIAAELENIGTDLIEKTVADVEAGLSDTRTSQLLTLTEVGKELGMSRTALYYLRRSQSLPPPIKISARKLRWRRSDIDEWLRAGCGAATAVDAS